MTIVSFAGLTYAQDFIDNALLFSRTQPFGSARIQGIGGTQTSLGGDFSSALSNPAGLGMYNRNEFTISSGFNSSNVSTEYYGTTTRDSRSGLNIPALSLVFNYPSQHETGFLGGSFAISMTRLNDFNQNFRYKGINDEHSIIDYFIEDATGINPEEMIISPYGGLPRKYFYTLTGLAYNNYLIDLIDENGFLYGSPLSFSRARQEEISKRRGAQYQWSIAYGANFSDRFFAGASLGIASLRFELSQEYREYAFKGYPMIGYDPLKIFTINEEYDIRGSGINFTVGAIYRPLDFLQLGVSYVTPTRYQITDSYTASISSQWNNFDYYPDDPDDENLNSVSEQFDEPLISEYRLTIPSRLTVGATLISKIGFISTDVELVNYSNAQYKSTTDGDFNCENRDIKAEYQSVVNFRLGGEYRHGIYRLRAGYNYMADPTRNSELDSKVQFFTGGVGIRKREFFADLAMIFSHSNSIRAPYVLSGPDPIANQTFNNLRFVLTLGFIF